MTCETSKENADYLKMNSQHVNSSQSVCPQQLCTNVKQCSGFPHSWSQCDGTRFTNHTASAALVSPVTMNHLQHIFLSAVQNFDSLSVPQEKNHNLTASIFSALDLIFQCFSILPVDGLLG